MSTDINSLNGVSKDVALLLAGNKNAKTLSGSAESIFNKVNDTVNNLINAKDLTFSKIYQAIYDVAIAVKDFFKNSFLKIAKFCKDLANMVLDKFKELANHSGDREDLVNAAEGYVGKVGNRKVGNILFSNGKDEEWCADTVTTIVKDIVGEKLPKDFGSSSVQGLMNWGKSKKAYVDTANMTQKQRNEYILNNVKPGDIMIEKRNKSHTGIVTRVYEENGVVKFDTVEGNMGSKVASERRVGAKTYTANSKTLSGFVKMDQWLDD
ncbi:MAG: CHAP domain-containing protein [Candidatus Gastranaerophilales bacterium]|nr:CHAP domain-containing protein [Candidatus Gastranaerophilales bacterium]MCM1073446.1 CHAP domain-containing protein [Bacteroides sp.]